MAITKETVTMKAAETEDEFEIDVQSVAQPIDGDPTDKHFLYMEQLSLNDIKMYLDEAHAADLVVRDPQIAGLELLPFTELKAVMRQPSTRTGGSMMTAIKKLGGNGEPISGQKSSSEAKGESLPDSWVAYATQADIIGTRTEEEFGPALAAQSIDQAVEYGKLSKVVPVINLGDGKWQHPTQALGDLFTIHKFFGELEGLKIAIVGDHERYRAHHSLMLGAAAVGMQVIAVESPIARIPDSIIDTVGPSLIDRGNDLDVAMAEADVLYIGRNPDEYTGKDTDEMARSRLLARQYEDWKVDLERLQIMRRDAIVMHPRPRRTELDPDVDSDPRMRDVEQMENMIPMRMAIIARHLGKSIVAAVAEIEAA